MLVARNRPVYPARTMNEPIISVLGVGLALGLRHALEPDHVATVTTLAGSGSRLVDAWRLAIAWAIGHTATIALVAGVGALLGLSLPESFWPVAEFLVGIVLILLGGSVLWRWARGRWHVHAHAHDGVPHMHLHSHARNSAHTHTHPSATTRTALGIGLLHGLAGSGAVFALLVAIAPSQAERWTWLGAVGAGTVVGMIAVSSAVFVVASASAMRGRSWISAFRLGSSAITVLVGIQLALRSLAAF